MVNGKSLPSSPFQRREEIFKFNNESQNTCENEIKTAVISQCWIIEKENLLNQNLNHCGVHIF